MGKLQGDIDIINAELGFLRTKYNQAFQEKDFRKLKGLSLWISKLEKKLEAAQQKKARHSIDYIKEYKNSKRSNGSANVSNQKSA